MALGVAVVGAGMAGRGRAAAYRAFLQEVVGLPESAALPNWASFEDGLHNIRVIGAVASSFAKKGVVVEVPPLPRAT